MEPVSAGASILAILQVSCESAIWVSKTLGTIKKAPTMVNSLAKDVAALQSVLLQLKNCGMVKLDTNDRLKVAISQCGEDLRSLAHALEGLAIKGHDRAAGKLWKSIQTAAKEQGLAEIQSRVQRHVQVLTLGLSVLQSEHMSSSAEKFEELVNLSMQKDELRSSLRSIHNAIASTGSVQSATLGAIMRQVQDLRTNSAMNSVTITKEFQLASNFRDDMRVRQLEQMRYDCETWLKAPNVRQVRRNLSINRLPGTCEWILSHPGYKTWSPLDGSSNLIGLSGKNGSGKSVLASWIADHLESEGHNLVFFPFSGTDAARQDLDSLYRSAVSQLLKIPAFEKGFDSIMRSAILHGQPSTPDLWDILIQISRLSISRPTYWVLDGVDELAGPIMDELWKRLPLLHDANSESRVLVIGRPHIFKPDIPAERIIALSADVIKIDIAKFALAETSKIPLLRQPALLRMAVAAAIDKSDGMFLWAKLLLEDLGRAGSSHEIKQKLSRLPIGMNAMYRKILGEILGRHEREGGFGLQGAQYILSIVTSAQRPMTVAEVQQAQALAFVAAAKEDMGHSSYQDGDDSDDDVEDARACVEEYLLDQPEKRILQLCSPLVVINDGIVSLIHVSAKEFLTRPKEAWDKDDPLQRLRVDIRDSNQLLASVCLEYLSSRGQASRDLDLYDEPPPLDDYACSYLIRHIKQGGRFPHEKIQHLVATGGLVSWLESCLLLAAQDTPSAFKLYAEACEVFQPDSDSDSDNDADSYLKSASDDSDSKSEYSETDPESELGESQEVNPSAASKAALFHTMGMPSGDRSPAVEVDLFDMVKQAFSDGLLERERTLGPGHWRTQVVRLVTSLLGSSALEEGGDDGQEEKESNGKEADSLSLSAARDLFEHQLAHDLETHSSLPPPSKLALVARVLDMATKAKTMTGPIDCLFRLLHKSSAKIPVLLLYLVAHIYAAFGRYDSAIDVLGTCLERLDTLIIPNSQEKQDDDSHSKLRLYILDTLGQLYTRVSNAPAAENAFTLCLAGRRELSSSSHKLLLATTHRLLHNLRQQGKHAAAMAITSQTTATIKSELGASHPKTIEMSILHAESLARAGHHSDAALLLRKQLLKLSSSSNTSLSSKAKLLRQAREIVSLLRRHAGSSSATDLLEMVATAQTDLLGATHKETLRSRVEQAMMLFGMGQYDECEAVCGLVQASQVFEGKVGPRAKAWVGMSLRQNQVRQFWDLEYCGRELGIGTGNRRHPLPTESELVARASAVMGSGGAAAAASSSWHEEVTVACGTGSGPEPGYFRGPREVPRARTLTKDAFGPLLPPPRDEALQFTERAEGSKGLDDEESHQGCAAAGGEREAYRLEVEEGCPGVDLASLRQMLLRGGGGGAHLPPLCGRNHPRSALLLAAGI
ncbi:hypothetical protein B0H63DRAFT_110813 [Podospora didyma]|uniref:NACHT domain-containing protein n=1 Tax=Podospora didyma TaxID=330526 RepID=A0AAE0NZ73_9PEZI|nr:hypothetical protein B0H63DRAFT_110813 [Podospora didyma]